MLRLKEISQIVLIILNTVLKMISPSKIQNTANKISQFSNEVMQFT